jgi:hypothetical protein
VAPDLLTAELLAGCARLPAMEVAVLDRALGSLIARVLTPERDARVGAGLTGRRRPAV